LFLRCLLLGEGAFWSRERDMFLQRIAAVAAAQSRSFTDSDVADVAQLALARRPER
jgi:hypothetical protein